MHSGKRKRLTHSQSRDMWRRWREGQTLTEIDAAHAVPTVSVFATIRRSGGYSPSERTRAGVLCSVRLSMTTAVGFASRPAAIRRISRRSCTIDLPPISGPAL